MTGEELPRYRIVQARGQTSSGQTGPVWRVYLEGKGLFLCQCDTYDMAHVIADKLGIAAHVIARTPVEELRAAPYLTLEEGDPAPEEEGEEGADWSGYVPAAPAMAHIVDSQLPRCSVCAGSGYVYRYDEADEFTRQPAERCPRCHGTGSPLLKIGGGAE